METNQTSDLIHQTKSDLKQALKDHDGDLKHSGVTQLIEKLVSLNPNPAPTEAQTLLEGNWKLISAPNFSGRIADEEHRYVYTLGRLAFNQFEPINLKIAIEKVFQPVFPTGNENEYSHDIVVNFKIIDENTPNLRGVIRNLAVCTPIDSNTVQVMFTGALLAPSQQQSQQEFQQWISLFGDSHKSSHISLLERLKNGFIKKILGIGKVSELNRKTGEQYFPISRSPKGLLNILYLDEEIRIKRGNRGTVLVCQKVE
ncbi:MAG: PAP/fibrillin family protein [Halothece sp.]